MGDVTDEESALWDDLELNVVPTMVLFRGATLLFTDGRPIVGEDVATSDSSQLPATMGFAPPGTSHHGLGDCRCIAGTLRILRRQGKF